MATLQSVIHIPLWITAELHRMANSECAACIACSEDDRGGMNMKRKTKVSINLRNTFKSIKSLVGSHIMLNFSQSHAFTGGLLYSGCMFHHMMLRVSEYRPMQCTASKLSWHIHNTIKLLLAHPVNPVPSTLGLTT